MIIEFVRRSRALRSSSEAFLNRERALSTSPLRISSMRLRRAKIVGTTSPLPWPRPGTLPRLEPRFFALECVRSGLVEPDGSDQAAFVLYRCIGNCPPSRPKPNAFYIGNYASDADCFSGFFNFAYGYSRTEILITKREMPKQIPDGFNA